MSEQTAHHAPITLSESCRDYDEEMTDWSELNNDEMDRADLRKKFLDRAREKFATKSHRDTISLDNLKEIWSIFEDILPTHIDGEAEGLIRRFQKLEVENKGFIADNRSLQEQDTKLSAKIQSLQDEVHTLQAKNKSLESLRSKQDNEHKRFSDERASLLGTITTQEMSIAQSKHDLQERKQEVRSLHSIIVRSRPESDPFDDHHFTTSFGTLEANIQNLVKKYFGATLGESSLKALNSVHAPDDRDLFLQSYVAKYVWHGCFNHDALFFGLDQETEERQGDFEVRLQKRQVDEDEIASWRIQTIKLGERLKSPRRHHLIRPLMALPERVLHPDHRHNAKKSLQAIANFAYDLALEIRRCRARYEWAQTAPPASFNELDIDRIEGYNTRVEGNAGSPSKVLFGPVYKRVDNENVLLKKGVVLFN